jgi:hypothetical protein|tara:strand:+ start:597 stop:1325 length:729 start_codon:yes stop_codon:yes gene_type:complete
MKSTKLFNLTKILFVLISVLACNNKEPELQQYQIIKSLINQLHVDTEQNLEILGTNKRQFYKTVDSLGQNGKVLQKIKKQIKEVEDNFLTFNNCYNEIIKKFKGIVILKKPNPSIYQVYQNIDTLIIPNSDKSFQKPNYKNFIKSSYNLLKAIDKSINNNCVMEDEWLSIELRNTFGYNHKQNTPSNLFLSGIKNSTSEIEELVELMIVKNQILKQTSLTYKYSLQTCALDFKVQLNKRVNK